MASLRIWLLIGTVGRYEFFRFGMGLSKLGHKMLLRKEAGDEEISCIAGGGRNYKWGL